MLELLQTCGGLGGATLRRRKQDSKDSPDSMPVQLASEQSV